MRHQSTYFYMAVLAIADEMVLINGCLSFWIYLRTGKNITTLSAISCKMACIGELIDEYRYKACELLELI